MNLVMLVKENQFFKPVYSTLIKIVHIVPFYLLEEGTSESNIESNYVHDNLSVRFLDASDISTLATHNEVDENEKELLGRLSNGCLCLGLMHNNNIAAYTWCDLQSCKYGKRLSFKLKNDEAYLFDARTFANYRGKSLAPFLRTQLYKELEKLGRSKYYSVSVTLNKSAIKFKQKLKARIIKKYLYIRIFNTFHVTVLRKNYLTE